MLIDFTAEELNQIEQIRRRFHYAIESATDAKVRAQYRLQLQEGLERYLEQCQRKRFDRIAGDPDAILQNVQEQAERILQIQYEELMAHTTPEDRKTMKELSGFFSTVKGKEYLSATFATDVLKEEFNLHINALQKDEKRLQQLFSYIIEAVEASEFTDSAEIDADNMEIPPEIMRFRRHPLSDIMSYGIMNDKANAQLLQDDGHIFNQETNGQLTLQWAVNQAPQKQKEVPIYISLSYEGSEGTITKKLTAFDHAVYNAVATRFHYWGRENPQKPLYITPQEVWRTMNGKRSGDGQAKPSDTQVKKICNSLDKMRFTRFLMDFSEEIRKFNLQIDDERVIGGHIDGYLLNCTKAEFTTDKGNVVSGYRIGEEPLLYTYNAAKNHILYVPYEMLDTSTNTRDLENVTEFRNYLLQQIQLMKNAAEEGKKGKFYKRSNTILLETIYKSTGILPPEERLSGRDFNSEASKNTVIRRLRKTDREKIEQILDAWKTKGWIQDYTALNFNNEPVREKQKVKGYQIKI